ncbi:beta-lactamase-like protein [Suillus subaureus]|uniref:Beta-lactamase-like protein n=1 Tax=Suillus subaureus TaxID=48587 RepID=A0A9P7E9T5_9AGAM|nr:beta-lactamase-like protein [Suillus subaureus]KAG1815561.1 beta-lactamase-like protein [Suillus subaureus]
MTGRRGLSSVNLTFLGTASAQPSLTRNHSALALRLNSDVWLFDCGEATQHQVQRSKVKMGKIEKIFITHTHGDHIFGLLPLLAIDRIEDPRTHMIQNSSVPIEIYGPFGTRAYVRNGLKYTHTLLGAPYVMETIPPLPFMHPESLNGRNIPQTNGVWSDVYRDSIVSVSAAPILHSVPCIGYVVTEAPVPGKMDPAKYIPHLKRTKTPMSVMNRLQQGESIELSDGTVLQGPLKRPGRKLVILGDTYDPSPIAELASSADLLIHEATNAHLPALDPHTKAEDTFESVEARTKSRGHSTPQMAGAFAARIGTRQLVLNHFSARYPGNDDVDPTAKTIMEDIARLAGEHYSGKIICARDFMSFDVDVPQEHA